MNARSHPAPELSVILAAPDGFASVRQTVAHLRAQTALDRLELVLVLPPDSEPVPAGDIEPFRSLTRVQQSSTSIGQANAAGVREASAPIVALAEDHCFPEPDWAEALLNAHRSSWAAVGPGVRNANPATVVSWADFFIGYGPWMLPAERAEAEFLPGHNSSYKKDVLLAYGPDLGRMLEAETLLHWEMRQRGQRLLLEPAAKVAHTNFSLWRSWLPIQYHAGRLFGGTRARDMSTWKRAVYVAGSPLIPLVRLARLAGHARRARHLMRFVRTLPALGIGLGLDAFGQFMGYLAGVGSAGEQVARYEYRRADHITSHDRQQVFGA